MSDTPKTILTEEPKFKSETFTVPPRNNVPKVRTAPFAPDRVHKPAMSSPIVPPKFKDLI